MPKMQANEPRLPPAPPDNRAINRRPLTCDRQRASNARAIVNPAAAPYDTLTTAWRSPASTIASRIPSRSSRGSSRAIGISSDDRQIHLESHLEMKVFQMIERMRPAHIHEQPPAVEYIDEDGEIHEHTFDFLVTWQAGTKTAFIVKMAKSVEKHDWRGRRDRIAACNPGYADQFAIVTERQCPEYEVSNAGLIIETRRMPLAAEAEARVTALVGTLTGPIRIADLVESSGLARHTAFRAIVRLIDNGVLVQVRKERIDYPAFVYRLQHEEVAG